MTTIDPTAEAAREEARQASGQFGNQEHSAPETVLSDEKPLTDQISEYLSDYDDAEAAYERDGEGYGRDADDAYEAWEDFRTGHAGDAYAMLEASKKEIERLQAELEAQRAKFEIPENLVSVIDKDHENYEEPLLYVPIDGHQGDWVDVIAASDGAHRKYTLTPEGEIQRNFD